VSPRQLGKYSEADLTDSPPRERMNGTTDHLSEQFSGITPAAASAKTETP
jgi:hypothetical protein